MLCLLLLTAATALAGKKRSQTLYWGAQIGPQLTGAAAPWDMKPVQKFARLTGKNLSLVQFSAPWLECGSGCRFSEFPTTPMENVRRYGAIPVFGWSSASSAPTARQPNFQLSDVIHGRYDSYIRRFATDAKRWGHPFFLRFDWEMNGFWFPWSERVNGNRGGQYIAAWRHVHDIFSSVGANNATWVWCPNVNISGHLQNLRSVYPGNRYVDWTCLDGFNWGVRSGSPGWLSFRQIYAKTYRQVTRLAPRKPMMLAEIASTDRGGSKSAWIRNMLHTVRTNYRKIRGLIWLDLEDRGAHWPIETSSSASRAFRQGIANPAYRPNEFGKIASGPIKPPRR
jgi:hypothetical protein